MELLDRYLQAVKKHLQWKRQDDIVAELRANLEAQLEDREAALGRPLTIGEAEDWLRELGAPAEVAARYQPQRFLIGPVLFPTYWYVLRMVWLWAAVIYAIVSVVEILSGTPNATAVLDAVLRVPGILFTTAAWVTLIFVVIEFVARRYPEKWQEIGAPLQAHGDWQPSSLPPLEKDHAGARRPKTRAHAIAEVIFGFIFLVWLLLAPRHPWLLLGPGALYLQASPFQIAPVLVTFYWWVVGLNVVQLMWSAVELARGTWQTRNRAVDTTIKLVGLVPLFVLLNAPNRVCVMLKHPALDQAQYGAAMDQINQFIHTGALIVLVIVMVQLVAELGKLAVGGWRKRVAGQPSA
jgi:hypothetical protein